MSLGDPLRTEGDVDHATALDEVLGDIRRRAGIDGASKGHQRAVAQERGDLIDRLLEDRHRWPEELVDRRPDHDHQGHRPGDHLAGRPELEASSREDVAEELIGTGLEERHLAGSDAVQSCLVCVVDADPQAGLGKDEAKW